MQEGSSPPLAYTAEVGFFLFIDIYTRTRAYIYDEKAGGARERERERGRGRGERGERGTDIRGHTEFLTSPGSL